MKIDSNVLAAIIGVIGAAILGVLGWIVQQVARLDASSQHLHDCMERKMKDSDERITRLETFREVINMKLDILLARAGGRMPEPPEN